jgi:hypothetical protein
VRSVRLNVSLSRCRARITGGAGVTAPFFDDDGGEDWEHNFKTKQRCAAGLRNLTWFDGGEQRMIDQGALAALIDLSTTDDPEIRRHVGMFVLD